ncbi:hypothetical protein K470DRAFT_257440 [Piedraia hortae CBS 480.64]|uniref:Uncharacterized protein n=1 Tax=Piedraia hortae CBS 480.64 TaxID=1314780 RepID=A0A6A7C0R3_9PEZI|nr:hypothetical protein K470DRAFT_257440 [Piedraia hortae CBS 480.64]
MREWVDLLVKIVTSYVDATRRKFVKDPTGESTTVPYLGRGSRMMYRFIRGTLGIRLHKGLEEHSTRNPRGRTIGGDISRVYTALRGGEMRGVLVGSLS